MVFGVCNNGVFLTNPLESVTESVLSKQLCSESELLIRRSDVISKWTLSCDLETLIEVEDDDRWEQYNVIGQVINVLREEALFANYSSGEALMKLYQTVLKKGQHIDLCEQTIITQRNFHNSIHQVVCIVSIVCILVVALSVGSLFDAVFCRSHQIVSLLLVPSCERTHLGMAIVR